MIRNHLTLSEAIPELDQLKELSFGEQVQQLQSDVVGWINSHSAQLMIGAGMALLLFFLLMGLRRIGRKLYEKDTSLTNMRSVIGRAMAKTRTWFMITIAVETLSIISRPPTEIAGVIHFLFFIAAVLQSAIWARAIILGFVEHRTSVDEDVSESLINAMKLIRVIVSVAVAAIAGIVILDNLNVDVTGLIAGLGIGGIAIGLAAQGIFSDLFAALSIIFDKPFGKGDTIHYDGTFATVEQIGLKSTRLRNVGGEEVIISNTNLLDKEILNLTRLDRRRIRFNVGVIYQTPPDLAARVPEILKEVVEEIGHVFVRAGFQGFGDSSLDYEVQFDVMSPVWDVVYEAQHKIGIAIFQRFAKEGLEFAYPTQTTFTAAPDGEMIMPYPNVTMVATDKKGD